MRSFPEQTGQAVPEDDAVSRLPPTRGGRMIVKDYGIVLLQKLTIKLALTSLSTFMAFCNVAAIAIKTLVPTFITHKQDRCRSAALT